MNVAPQELLKEYVKSQHFTSTAEIMTAMKEMFRDVVQTAMEVELDGTGAGTLPAGGGIRHSAQLPQRLLPEDGEDTAWGSGHQSPPGPERHLRAEAHREVQPQCGRHGGEDPGPLRLRDEPA